MTVFRLLFQWKIYKSPSKLFLPYLYFYTLLPDKFSSDIYLKQFNVFMFKYNATELFILKTIQDDFTSFQKSLTL